jgi:hypothetical protein
MPELEIEKIAQDRYRLRFRGQVLTVDAQGMRDLSDWCLLHMQSVEREAKEAQAVREYNAAMDERAQHIRENGDKPWLPPAE